MSEAIVDIKKLWTVFPNGEKKAVVHKDLDLTVERGEVLSLVGGSGTGKTVLLRQMLGLAGGMLVSNFSLGITPSFFLLALPKAVPIANLFLATVKSVVFGVLIALIGCHYGLRVKPNTESLGQGTTASVVTSITVVILVDALFAVLFKSVGI